MGCAAAVQAIKLLPLEPLNGQEADTEKVHNALADALRDAGLTFRDGSDVTAPVTYLRIQADGEDQEVVCTSVAHCARRRKDVKEAERLYEIQKRLDPLVKDIETVEKK
jgi:hypothetical protein